MRPSPILLIVCNILHMASSIGQLPSTYEYFTRDGIKTGLTAEQPGFFKLNGKDIRIISGSLHYFRIHPDYWRTSLRKLRSIGANTVETYAPWNLHGVFDFGNGGRDFSLFLNVRRFVQMAKEEDLLVIFRPGPYIGAEWDFGGIPSWLLRDPNLKVRTNYGPWMKAMENYFNILLPQVADLQFARGGGIILMQVENEYGFFGPKSTAYLQKIQHIFQLNGFGRTLICAADVTALNRDTGVLPGTFMTATFQTLAAVHLGILKSLQPSRPIMVMEYWTGWYDRWFDYKHATFDLHIFKWELETIFKDFAGSVNLYMFQGGTTFGFMAGNSKFYQGSKSIVTSHDYDAILSEAGDYTKKYYITRDLIVKYQVPELRAPKLVLETRKSEYGTVYMQEFLNYFDIIGQVPGKVRSTVQKPVAMENLNINGGNGQSYGYIVYRNIYSHAVAGSVSLKAGPVRDIGIVLVDGVVQPSKGTYWYQKDIETKVFLSTGKYALDILVENSGRYNFFFYSSFDDCARGLPNGTVSVNGVELSEFEVIPLEFNSKWVSKLEGWKAIGGNRVVSGPTMLRATFQVDGSPADTFLDMQGWHKGIVFINGFNIGRYWKVGPQKTLYVPAPLLRQGTNGIVIFEQLEPNNSVRFVSKPELG